MTDPNAIEPDFDIVSVKTDNGDDGALVGIIRVDGAEDFDLGPGGEDFGPVGVNVDRLEDLVEQCREMGWGKVTLYLRENSLVLAHEYQQDHHGIFAGLAPLLPDEDGENGEEKQEANG